MNGVMRIEDMLCRFGGDEFVVLLDPGVSATSAEGIAERVRDALRVPFELDGHVVSVTTSVGIASDQDCAIDQIVSNADVAMHQAKTVRKNTTVRFLPQMQMLAEERLHLAFDMQAAIVNSEFTVLYQPIMSVQGRVMVGTEALVRWDHPTRGRLLCE